MNKPVNIKQCESTIEEGNRRFFFFSKSHEVILHEIDPGVIHPYHYHKKTFECCMVIEGEIEVEIKLKNGADRFILKKMDIFEFEPFIPHRLKNRSKNICKIVTIKIPPRLRDKVDYQ